MTADQLIAKLRALPPDPRTASEFMQFLRLGLTFIEKHFYELELADGTVIANGDISSAVAGIREIRDATLGPLPVELRPSRFTPRVSDYCTTCDHEHEGRTECGKYLGEGKFCQCEEKVPA